MLSDFFESYKIFETTSKEHAQDLIRSNINEFDVFVACGGDGTIQQVASKLVGKNKIMGILPLGSGNDFVKLFDQSGNLNSYLRILRDGVPCKYDLININNNQYCINTFGIGFDADANEIASSTRIHLGKFKYIYSAMMSLFKITPIELSIKVDNKETRYFNSFMVVISNGKWEGGTFLISPESNPKDGLLEMTISTSRNKWKLLIQIVRLVTGNKLDPKEFEILKFKTAHISLNKPVIAHSDGEVIQSYSNFHFKVLSRAVSILTPVN